MSDEWWRGCNGFGTYNSLSYDPDLGPLVNQTHDPVALVKATQNISINSRRFIEKFTALDVNPIDPVDPTTTAQRNAQIIAYTKQIVGYELTNATDDQVLNFYRTAMMGWY